MRQLELNDSLLKFVSPFKLQDEIGLTDAQLALLMTSWAVGTKLILKPKNAGQRQELNYVFSGAKVAMSPIYPCLSAKLAELFASKAEHKANFQDVLRMVVHNSVEIDRGCAAKVLLGSAYLFYEAGNFSQGVDTATLGLATLLGSTEALSSVKQLIQLLMTRLSTHQIPSEDLTTALASIDLLVQTSRKEKIENEELVECAIAIHQYCLKKECVDSTTNLKWKLLNLEQLIDLLLPVPWTLNKTTAVNRIKARIRELEICFESIFFVLEEYVRITSGNTWKDTYRKYIRLSGTTFRLSGESRIAEKFEQRSEEFLASV